MYRSRALRVEALEVRNLMASASLADLWPVVPGAQTIHLHGVGRISRVTDQFAQLDPSDEYNKAYPLHHLISFFTTPGYELGLSVVNLRTGEQVQGSSVLEGDVLEVKLVGERAAAVSGLLSRFEPDPQFEIVDDRRILIQATTAGTFKIAFTPRLEEIRGAILGFTGKTPEFFQRPLEALLSPLTLTVHVQPNSDRPSAANASYRYQPFEGLQTARDVLELLQKPEALTLKIGADQGLLKDQSSSQLKTVMVRGPSRGQLQLNTDGSFDYTVNHHLHDSSLFDFTNQGDTFTYAVVGQQGISDTRTVHIQTRPLPLVDLSMKVRDANGREISSIASGQEFTLEVIAFSNNIYRTAPEDYSPFQPLEVSYRVDGNVQLVGAPITPERFRWERFSLGQENNKLVLLSEMAGPRFVADSQITRAYFDHYSMDSQVTSLFRQTMVATETGAIRFSIDKAILKLANENVSEAQVWGTSLEVTSATAVSAATSTRNPLDVSGTDGVSPLDALLIINRLNTVTESEEPLVANSTPSVDPFDVNEDGLVSPLDALMVINWLNAHSSSEAEGEKQSTPIAPDIVDLMFTEDGNRSRKKAWRW